MGFFCSKDSTERRNRLGLDTRGMDDEILTVAAGEYVFLNGQLVGVRILMLSERVGIREIHCSLTA